LQGTANNSTHGSTSQKPHPCSNNPGHLASPLNKRNKILKKHL
jgi:hypothetical protein